MKRYQICLYQIVESKEDAKALHEKIKEFVAEHKDLHYNGSYQETFEEKPR